jgi:hypothetical protein
MRHCLLQARPNFTENCASWEGVTVNDSGQVVPRACQLQAQSHWDTMKIINDSVVLFIGDSTARRAGLQLRSFLANTSFSDVMHDDDSYHNTVFSEVSDPSVGFSSMIASLWYPHIADLAGSLSNSSEFQSRTYSQLFSHWPFAYTANRHDAALTKWRNKRKIIVLHYSSWDMRHGLRVRYWYEHMPEFFGRFVGNLTNTISLVKHQPGVHMKRDTVLLRLPIAHGCEFSKSNKLAFRFGCNRPKSPVDPVNDQILELSHRMMKSVAEVHPDVGMIDVFSWTKSKTGAGRAPCTPTDNKGVHFSTDQARLAYVQQVLFGAKMYSASESGVVLRT